MVHLRPLDQADMYLATRARGYDIELVQRYIQNSLCLESEQMSHICAVAAKHKIAVVLGYSERDGNSLFLGQCYIDSDGVIKMHRRKIKPTHMERTVFGDGSGDSLLNVVDDPKVAKVGALCCWERAFAATAKVSHALSRGTDTCCCLACPTASRGG